MVDSPLLFLVLVLIGLLIIAGILIVRVIIAEIKKPSNEQLILFSLLGIIIVFLIPYILALIKIL
jgi:hypothetical protein